MARGGLGPKSLRGNRIYKGRKKASHRFKKALIPLKMYSKSLAILEKSSIDLKKSSKIFEILTKDPHF
jgi:hypothetical protein